MRRGTRWGLTAAAAGACVYAASFAIDFSVYHAITRSVLFQGGWPYGEASGLPWPMWYRYPPLFLLLFLPFALPPFRVSALIWAAGKLLALAAVAAALARRGVAPRGWRGWTLAALLAGPYALAELRYGNAQFFVFALTAAALLSATRPGWAAAALGCAAALKVWPLFFAPYLIARRRLGTALGAAGVAAALTLAPALWFGAERQMAMLGDWFLQESEIAADAGRMWFPSQSLLGVLTRHLTDIDYRSMPDPGWSDVNWLWLEAATVRRGWMALAGAGYLALLALAWRRPAGFDAPLDGFAFCALILLQPYAQRQIALCVLVWPALVAAAPGLAARARPLVGSSAAIVTLQLLTPSAYWQRVYQVWGLDALAVALLAAGLLVHLLAAERPLPSKR